MELHFKLQEKLHYVTVPIMIFLIVLVMPCLTDIVGDLQEQVKLLKDSQQYPVVHNSSPSRPSSAASTSSGHSSTSTPSRTPSVASAADVESEMASFL